MYRIAVIENETELQRYGHAHVARNLALAVSLRPDAKYYNFQSFTSANIGQLFQPGDNYIMEFDALFLSTNACSDSVVLSHLRNHKDRMIEFIENEKGIYVGYQKKLSKENKSKDPDDFRKAAKTATANNPFEFLPSYYQFGLVEEFILDGSDEKPEFRTKESPEGDIKIYDKNRSDVILNYPSEIQEYDILKQCRNNEFQNHLYKSSIYPVLSGSFETLLYDDTPNEDDKRILLARAIPKNKERIIVSSIALDWENHASLLLNIIEFIAKGIPRHAFIQGKDDNSDFSYLISSAIISKIPCAKYSTIDEISAQMYSIHDIYYFAPSVKDTVVKRFWSKLSTEKGKKKIYHLLTSDSSSEEFVLTQYSNSSALDTIKINVHAWLNNYQNTQARGFWDGFWVTYDTLLMMHAIGLDYSPYLNGVYADMAKRRRGDGSYDRLIGCTLGMLKLLLLFWPDKKAQICQTHEWIISRIFPSGTSTTVDHMPISAFEKESFLITYKENEEAIKDICRYNVKNESFDSLFHEVQTSFVEPQSRSNDCSEIELCRHLQFCNYFQLPYTHIVHAIMGKRDSEGKWAGVSRTAGVLIILLSTLGKEDILRDKLDKRFEESINYIRMHYDATTSNWNNLVLDTVRAVQALYLYDKMFTLATRDFFETVQHDVEIIGYSNIVQESLVTSSRLQQSLYAIEENYETIKDEKKALINSEQALKQRVNELELKMEAQKSEDKNMREADRKRYENRWRIGTGLSLFLGFVTIGLLSFIVFDLQAAGKLFTQLGSLIAMTVSLFLSLAIEGYLHRKLFPETFENKNGDRLSKRRWFKKSSNKENMDSSP